MSDTTNILDLPTDPIGGGNVANNITMTANEQPRASDGADNSMKLDETTINQIVNGLQKAALSGSTRLPSRDIPMTTEHINNDPEITPNYVPPPPPQHDDYIRDYEKTSDIMNQHNQKKQNENALDEMYNELQTPLLLAVLYFLFQLPFVKRLLYKNLSFLFLNDGNYNLNGYLFVSCLFGMIYYLITKTTHYFSIF